MLDLIWTAYFSSEPRIVRQYDDAEQTIEHSSKEVFDREDDLEKFEFRNVHTNVLYTVDLLEGMVDVTLNGLEHAVPRNDDTDMSMVRKYPYDYRLIFRRQVSQHANSNYVLIGQDIVYLLGFQYLDKNGSCHKRIMKIFPDGRLIVN